MSETRNIWKEIDEMYEADEAEKRDKIKREVAMRLRTRKMLRNR